QLLVTRDEKRELRLKRGTGLPLVKRLQKRIVLGFADTLRVQGLGNYLAESALADPDGALNCDVPGWFEEVRHDRRKATIRRITCPGVRGNWLFGKRCFSLCV